MDSWSIGVGLVLAAATALGFGLRAMAHRSDYGRKHPITAWVLGSAAGRRYFDDHGWRYRNVAVYGSLAIWVAALVVAAAIG